MRDRPRAKRPRLRTIEINKQIPMIKEEKGEIDMGKKEGVLIIGHGSRLSYNKDVIELNAQRLREKGIKNVYVGFNEMSDPPIEEAIEKMVADGVDVIYALPLFISSGLHLTKDVPEKLGIPENSSGGIVKIKGKIITVKYSTAIGEDPRIADILNDRIAEMK